MTTSDANEQMTRHANAAVEMVEAEYGYTLDYSDDSIGAVESLLNSLWKEGDNPDEVLATASLLFGSYIGAIIRRSHPEAVWTSGSPTPGSPSPSLIVGTVTVYPISWCYKRLCLGPAESVIDKFLEFRREMDAGAPADEEA